MVKCRCAEGACECVIREGRGILVTGKGSATDPYVVSLLPASVIAPDDYTEEGSILDLSGQIHSDMLVKVYADSVNVEVRLPTDAPPGVRIDVRLVNSLGGIVTVTGGDQTWIGAEPIDGDGTFWRTYLQVAQGVWLVKHHYGPESEDPTEAHAGADNGSLQVGFGALVEPGVPGDENYDSIALGPFTYVVTNSAIALGRSSIVAKDKWNSVAINHSMNSATSPYQVYIGEDLHTWKIRGRLCLRLLAPSSSSDPTGTVGDIAISSTYIFARTTTGWKRTPIASY